MFVNRQGVSVQAREVFNEHLVDVYVIWHVTSHAPGSQHQFASTTLDPPTSVIIITIIIIIIISFVFVVLSS